MITDDPIKHKYGASTPSLSENVSPPSYEMILDWMRSSPGRAISYDIWARGNYTRRIIHNLRNEGTPLIIPFNRVNQMRWAHRRLSLLGIPVEFVYMGGVTEPRKILHLYPEEGVVNEGGWGYIGALGTIIKIKGKRWFPVIGYSQLMPEAVLDWLTEEASDDFLQGDVFISAAELIGIDPASPDLGTQAIEDITSGRRVWDVTHAAKALMQLDLPYIDRMSHSSFRKWLSEYENDLIRFRLAFKKLIAGVPECDMDNVVEEIQSEVAALCQSDRFTALRRAVVLLGGTLVTVSATVAAALAVPLEFALPVGAAAGAAAATTALTELWKQRLEGTGKLRENPFFIALKLGLDKPSKVRKGHVYVQMKKIQRVSRADYGNLADFHWLCPPRPGLLFAAVKESS